MIRIEDIRVGDEVSVRVKVESVLTESIGTVSARFFHLADIVTHTPKPRFAVGDKVRAKPQQIGPSHFIASNEPAATVVAIHDNKFWARFDGFDDDHDVLSICSDWERVP